ncbi:B-cell linker protein isoform X2 [Vanacampus margaritifer]
MFAGQALSGSYTLHGPWQTLQDRCSSPEDKAGTLELVEFVVLCQYFKSILQEEDTRTGKKGWHQGEKEGQMAWILFWITGQRVVDHKALDLMLPDLTSQKEDSIFMPEAKPSFEAAAPPAVSHRHAASAAGLPTLMLSVNQLMCSTCILERFFRPHPFSHAHRDEALLSSDTTGTHTSTWRVPAVTEMNLPSREQCEGWDQSQVGLFKGKNMSDGDMSKCGALHRPQLQKIAQDIQKNDTSYLNKFRRLKSKPVPEVPLRDYGDDDMVGAEDMSDSEYDNEMYDNPQEHDISYEPPPSHKVFSRTSSSFFLTGAYIDRCHNGPKLEHRAAFKRGKESRQVALEPADSNDEDYISPVGSDEDDNYIEPADDPTPNLYEVPDPEDRMLGHVSANRAKMRRSPFAEHQAKSDSYEVWDHDDMPPKLLPRGSPNPALRPAQDVMQRDVERRTPPMIHPDRKPHPPKCLTLDMKRPKIPLPNVSYLKQTDSDYVGNGATGQDKDVEIYEKPWFAGECDRKTAEQLLFHTNKDGAFMVRKSSGQDTNQPYTLVVYYKGRVYNIPIRFTHRRQLYALGREKKGEEYFHSVAHIIENHQKSPLVLIDSKSNSKDAARLRFPMKPSTSVHHRRTSHAFSSL